MNYSIAIVGFRALLILGGEDVKAPILFPGSNNTLDMALMVDGSPIDASTLGGTGVSSATMVISDSEGNVLKTYSVNAFTLTTKKTVNGVLIGIVQFLHKIIASNDLPAPGFYQATLTTVDPVNTSGLTWEPFPVRVS